MKSYLINKENNSLFPNENNNNINYNDNNIDLKNYKDFINNNNQEYLRHIEESKLNI